MMIILMSCEVVPNWEYSEVIVLKPKVEKLKGKEKERVD